MRLNGFDLVPTDFFFFFASLSPIIDVEKKEEKKTEVNQNVFTRILFFFISILFFTESGKGSCYNAMKFMKCIVYTNFLCSQYVFWLPFYLFFFFLFSSFLLYIAPTSSVYTCKCVYCNLFPIYPQIS